MKVTNAKAGFSLVELMVVVAIIGVLAVVAVPNFLKFQAKAKQSSAKSELSGIYVAEQAFFVENTGYDTNLYGIGFVPDGMIAPATASSTFANAPTAPASFNHIYQVGFFDASGAAVAGHTGLPSNTLVNGNEFYSSYKNNSTATPAFGIATLVGSITPTGASSAFTAVAAGDIGGDQKDGWSITQGKVLANKIPGF